MTADEWIDENIWEPCNTTMFRTGWSIGHQHAQAENSALRGELAEALSMVERLTVELGEARKEKAMRTAWIPEAPDHPGLYANESGTDMDPGGKLGGPGLQPSTMSAEHAKQFATCEECQAWCDANPRPKFRPMEHGFYES